MPINSLRLANGHLGYKLDNFKKNSTNKLENSSKIESTKVAMEEYLKELKEVYPQVSIQVGNITSGNAESFAFSGTGIHNIAVSKEYLRKVINDPEKRREFKESIQNTINAQRWMKSMCQSDGSKLVATGSIIDSDGNMRSWSHTQRSSSDQKSNIFDSSNTQKKENLKRISKESDNIRKKEDKLRQEKRLLKRKEDKKILNEKLLKIKNDNKLLGKNLLDTYGNNNYIVEKNHDFSYKG
ncbi:MAG: DUF6033 family protein [Anaeromicrobium sp.]|nr:DUF6033 family protein [Anaeromicrobium sp.]